MGFRKGISLSLVFCFVFQNIFFFLPNIALAAPDSDGSANIDMVLSSTVPSSSIIGKNFTLDVALENKNTSDTDGYRPGFILSLPTGVSLVNAGTLGSPTRTLSVTGATLLFFQTTQIALKGVTLNFPITLSSTNSAGVFVDKNIGVLAYADDSIYGRGAAPSGSPPATLTGGIDYASGTGVSMPDPTDMTFPANITAATNLATLPFITPKTQFTPFDVTKIEETKDLIGKPMITTLKVSGNSMGDLQHFHLQDVLPANRAFSGFISTTGATIGGLHVTYDAPTPGRVTIDVTDISVPVNTDTIIQYETIPLAYTNDHYTSGLPVLDTGSVIPHRDPSPNTVTMHTGSLALVGGPYAPSTWNDGTSDILVDSSSVIPPRTVTAYNRYANLTKSGNTGGAVIGDVITYTIDLTTAMNAAFTTNGSGTYIIDHLPDGLTYSGTVSSSITSGVGTPLTFDSAVVDVDGDTTIIWRLNSGSIGANSNARVIYQAVLDGAYEGVGDTQYENADSLVNDASYYGTVGDGGLSGIWGQTDPSKIDTSVFIHATNGDNPTATIRAPTPVMKKQLISVTLPGGAVYDATTGLPPNLPPGSALRFALTMDFPNVYFINPKLIDALPLLAGPNTNVYNIAFQNNPTLKDIYNSGVLFNTDDGVTPGTSFNGLSLSGTSIPNASWVVTTPANNLEFHLNSGVGKRTFAVLFTVDVLPTKPSGGVATTGLVPLTNYAYSTYNNDSGTPTLLPVMDIPFTVDFPSLTLSKVASGASNIQAGSPVEYTVTITNTGSGPGYLENIIDTLPANMSFLTGSIVSSGSLASIANSAITQSGNTLLISFNTGGIAGPRSMITSDNTGTLLIKENIVIVRYTLVPTSAFVIQGGATRSNTVALDYFASSGAVSNGVNNLGPLTASANLTVTGASISRSLFSTTEVDSTSNNLYVGEEVTYRTILTLPQGTYNSANYVDTNNSNLTFLSGSIVVSSGSLAMSGTTFSGSTLTFGTIVNTDTDVNTLETIIIDTTYRVNKNATPGTSYGDVGTFNYSATSTAATVDVNIRKPTITLTKIPSPATADAGDTVTYTITVNNTSTTAHAYDLRITDLLPASLSYVTGSLVPGVFSGSENILFTSSGGGNGLSLDVLPTSSGASFSFQALVKTTVRPADTAINRADVIYDTLDDDNSVYEWSGATFATALVSVPDITLSHTITSTSLSDTTSALFSGALTDLAIGEQVSYTTVVGFPEAIATGVTLTQTLPAGMKFLSGYILIDGVKSHTLSNITISPDNVITFSLGDIDNTGIGAGSGITILTEAVLLDHAANTAGSIKTSSLQVNYSEKSKSANTFVEVVEPALSIVKDYSPNTGDGGDTVSTTITVTNTSLVTAYDVVLTDIAPSKLTPGVGYSGSVNIGTLAPGETRVYTYDSTITLSASPGEILIGTASVLYTTYPGTPVYGERSYTALDNDFINIVTPGSIALNLLSSSDVKIGDISQYEIRVPVGEGITNLLSLTSTLPAGMVIIPSSVVITPDPSVSYSGSVVPLVTPDSDTIGAGLTQTVSYAFTGVNNANTDNGTTEYITIRYDAVLQNSADTNAGNAKNHSVSALYDGSGTKTGASLPVTVREPDVRLSVSNSYAYDKTVPYTFTLVNSGSATAYDLDLSTLLPSGVSYSGTISITNSGGAIGLVRSGNSFTLTSLPVNLGNPLTFTINGEVAPSVPNFTPITLTGTVTYTSQPGAYTSQVTNILNTERSSVGGVNDYIDANKTTSFILNIPLLAETISVVDINGGDSIIGDLFEYTITLTNTGNVPLSGIPVTLDIPTGFTGFTVMSTPAGSTDLSTLSGGLNGAGYLSLSGISIPVGQSRTIVYRVTALTNVVPGTTISTPAQVGNSSEGAVGGTPSVPVTINAPLLVTTAVETDVNGGSLLRNETLHHTLTLSNSGTATGTNVTVTIPWGTGSTYTSGSLVFQSGTLVNISSVVVDEISGTITFTIPLLPPGASETFVFDSRTTGPVGTSISTVITARADDGVTSTRTSNILTIVDNPSGGGGGGGGSPLPTLPTLPPTPTTPVVPVTPETPKTPTKTPTKTPSKNTPKTPVPPAKTSLDDEYNAYLKMKKRLAALVDEENTAGAKTITNPKVLPQTGKSILSRVLKMVNAKLVLDVPKFSHGGKDTSPDLSFWLTDLPKQDQDRDEYIVLPSNGMITPINTVPENANDYKKLVSGREINVNTYLRTGVMTYPGTNNRGFGSVGNTVVFGHSSYWVDDSGRYKTHFQKIIEFEAGEEIWIYKKQPDSSYKRYRYTTTASYNVKATEVSVLDPGIGKNLTLFTCTPIGGITGRWVVKAKYIDEEKLSLEEALYGRLLSTQEQKTIKQYFNSIKKLSLSEKQASLLGKYDEVVAEQSSPYNRYFRMQIAKTYKELK